MTVEPNLVSIFELSENAVTRLACQDYETAVEMLRHIRTYAAQAMEAQREHDKAEAEAHAKSAETEDHPKEPG